MATLTINNDLLLYGEGPLVLDMTVLHRPPVPFAYQMACPACVDTGFDCVMTKDDLMTPWACGCCGWIGHEKTWDRLVAR